MGKLEGKVAVTTGGNSGIGLATAHAYAREGAQLVLMGRNQETLDEAVASFEGRAIGVQGDVSKTADVERLVDAVKQKHGRIDVLFDAIFGTKVRGAFQTVRKSEPLLSDGASVIFTGSVAGAAVFLASDDSSYVIGSSLPVDGGMSQI